MLEDALLTSQDIYAGGPGSGRHKDVFAPKQPSKWAKVSHKGSLQKHLSESTLAEQRRLAQAKRDALRNQGLSVRGKPILSDKQKLAVANTVIVGKAHHDQAEAVERLVAKHTKGIQSSNNSPFDVTVTGAHTGITHGIEVKTLLLQKNDKLTQKASAIKNKLTYAKKNKIKSMHTVAVDMRGKKPVLYHRVGNGSFRLGSMDKVQGGFKGLAKIFA